MARHQQYTEVSTEHEDIGRSGSGHSKKYFWRQIFVSSAIWTTYFSIGICLGTPTVYIPQVRRQANSTEAVSDEMVSLLASAYAYAAMPWCVILAFLTDYIGRKKTFILVALNQVLVATSYYLSTTPEHILISEVLQGMTHASTSIVCMIAVAEYTSAKNRGLVLTIKSATVFWAIWAANAIGAYASWRYITLLGFLNAFYSLTVWFWPESPFWLASRGKFEECRKSHRWLKGFSENSEKELELLINSHIEGRSIKRTRTLRNALTFLMKKEFYCPVGISMLMSMLHQLSGKQVVTVYAIDIVKKITSSESTAYKTMLILDGVTVFAMYLGCFLCKILKRRFMLFFFGSFAVLFLLCLSLYLYLVHLSYVLENKYITVVLLVGFSISIGAGPIILATSLYAELIPIRYKCQAVVIIACWFISIQAILLHNSYIMFKYFEMHGTFLFYAISVSCCLTVLYKYLPETKDKTLEEIEKHFKD